MKRLDAVVSLANRLRDDVRNIAFSASAEKFRQEATAALANFTEAHNQLPFDVQAEIDKANALLREHEG